MSSIAYQNLRGYSACPGERDVVDVRLGDGADNARREFLGVGNHSASVFLAVVSRQCLTVGKQCFSMTPSQTAIERACDAVGGKAALAQMIDVSPQAVHQWTQGLRQVPAERCPEIERATSGSVRCEELRPDVAWDVLRTSVL